MFLLPYVQLSDIEVLSAQAFGPGFPAQAIAIRPFGALVVLAIAVGVMLTLKQGARQGLSRGRLTTFMYFIVLCGFVGGHLFDIAFYSPDLAARDPSVWWSIAEGQSSFGGFVGAVAGVGLYRCLRGPPVFALVEVVASSFPQAWVVGRIGCAIAHDHPGIRSDSWLAVAYPAGGRFDLGLLEAFAVLPLAVTFLWLRRRPRPLGTYVGMMSVYYAILRFLLDFLRSTDLPYSDQRPFGLTPAQWGVLGLFGVGVYFSSLARLNAGAGAHALGSSVGRRERSKTPM